VKKERYEDGKNKTNPIQEDQIKLKEVPTDGCFPRGDQSVLASPGSGEGATKLSKGNQRKKAILYWKTKLLQD
jgi:hypothetical protein